ncbi:D-alanyl-D-alanine carboxypeptidase family protein [Bacillus thermotolerans]|uniref:D-alanyl-D-alanine carboxypeptidase family protein n=1 Tax=Bacillus thermotolerans TaxID=1221996 RepID=UPI00057FD9B6|nr:D-alanyl-D-alanine carboxypeptidase [Bacillus thermotolerans]KKB38395.1 D-alanyl-D-alanine carboxypeptidase [Bacillus thermotolerans]
MKRVFPLTAVICLVWSALFSTGMVHAEDDKVKLAEQTKSAILIEQTTGAVLFEKNSEQALPPASMTKIMTMLLVMEALEEKKLSWDEKVRASEYAASMGGSQIFLEPGEEMTVQEMMKGVAIGSANDASVALAERIAGSEEAFVERMNERAEELGMKQTKFKNATGLPVEGHHSSAHDMAIMARELLKHKDILTFTSTYEDYLREDSDKKFWLVNTNRLVKFYPGVDGLKTGFTNEAKYCLTATASKNNMRVIAVVFGAPTPKDRNAQVTKMLDYAFHQYEVNPLYKKGETLSEVRVAKGDKSEITLVTGEEVSLLTKKGEKQGKLSKDIKLKKNIQAPVKKGDELGQLVIKKDGEVVSSTPLVAKENVERASWWQFYKKVFHYFTKVETL